MNRKGTPKRVSKRQLLRKGIQANATGIEQLAQSYIQLSNVATALQQGFFGLVGVLVEKGLFESQAQAAEAIDAYVKAKIKEEEEAREKAEAEGEEGQENGNPESGDES